MKRNKGYTSVDLYYLGDDLIERKIETVTGATWMIITNRILDTATRFFGNDFTLRRDPPTALYPYIACTNGEKRGHCILIR